MLDQNRNRNHNQNQSHDVAPIKRERHFLYWMLLTVFSLISLVAFTSGRDGPWNRPSRWVITVTSISFGLSAIGAAATLFMTAGFAATTTELALILIVLGFWCAGLPSILDPSHSFGQNGQAVGQRFYFSVFNANIFFFSWGAFIVALKLLSVHLAQLLKRKDDKFLSTWILFTAASFVTMASASHIWRDGGCDSVGPKVCARTLFAVILGAVSGVLGLILVAIPSVAIHQIISILLLAAWCFEISYVSFGQGPATMVNTLYFSSWAGLITSLSIAALSFHKMIEKAMGRTDDTTAEEPGYGDRSQPAHGDRSLTNTKNVNTGTKNDIEEGEVEEIAPPPSENEIVIVQKTIEVQTIIK